MKDARASLLFIVFLRRWSKPISTLLLGKNVFLLTQPFHLHLLKVEHLDRHGVEWNHFGHLSVLDPRGQ